MLFYQDARTTLFLGNCIEEMANIENESVDLVLTDPPYNLSKPGKAIARDVRPNSPIAASKGDWDALTPEQFEALFKGFLDHSKRILKPNGTIIVCCSHHEEDNIKKWIVERFELLNRLIWHKTNPTPLFNKNRLVWSSEHLFIARKGKGNYIDWDQFGFTDMHDVWSGPICQGRERIKVDYVDDEGVTRKKSLHPTQKPLWLFDKAVRIFSPADGIVVDPFNGVGTAVVAARNNGRMGIGVDLSPEYLTATIGRLA